VDPRPLHAGHGLLCGTTRLLRILPETRNCIFALTFIACIRAYLTAPCQPTPVEYGNSTHSCRIMAMGALEKVLQVFTLNGRGILQADYTGTCPIADSFPQQTDYSDLDSSSRQQVDPNLLEALRPPSQTLKSRLEGNSSIHW